MKTNHLELPLEYKPVELNETEHSLTNSECEEDGNSFFER